MLIDHSRSVSLPDRSHFNPPACPAACTASARLAAVPIPSAAGALRRPPPLRQDNPSLANYHSILLLGASMTI
ncbi:hypothetical protein CC79DRAFT_1329525 [Sarocladium strictum]